MILVLRVVGRPDDTDQTPKMAYFDAAGGLIGRADTARLILPDPRRVVSRFHAHISYAGESFFIEDMGSTNPAAVNGQSLSPGQRMALNAGDQIRIGQYTIAAEMHEAEFAQTMPSLPAESAPDEIVEHTRIVARPLASAAAPAAVSATARAGAPVDASASALWQAFEDGADVSVEQPVGLRPEMMRLLGRMLRTLVGGTRRLMSQRAVARRGIDAEVTQMRGRANNPLKFATDDVRALTQLLKPPMPGFLAAPDALEEAMLDLESHSAAMNVAMRAAAEQLLGRFDPAQVERQAINSGLASFLPMARRAQLWDQYVREHRAAIGNSRDLFESAFGHAFLAAYEAEVARAKNSRKSPAPTLPERRAVPRLN